MNYTSNIDLSLEESNRYQAVYASQLYNTFFGVFAKFTVEHNETKVLADKKCNIKEISFSLINYKGPLNLEIVGFEDIMSQPEGTKNSPDNKGKVIDGFAGLSLTMVIQHTSSAKAIQKGFELKFDEDQKFEIKNGHYLLIMRKLIPMNHPLTSETEIGKKSFSNGVFDTEFYRRDGNYVNCIPQIKYSEDQRIDTELGHDPSNISDSQYDENCRSQGNVKNFTNTDSITYPWPKCIPGYNKIFFR